MIRTTVLLECDVPACTTRPVVLRSGPGRLPHGWSNGTILLTGSWSGQRAEFGGHFCPQHRRLSFTPFEPSKYSPPD